MRDNWSDKTSKHAEKLMFSRLGPEQLTKNHQTIFKIPMEGVCGNYQIRRTLPQNVTEN
jgi:hypothetical protein